jgi:2-polyprenyl-3-methyl-5-hydroxy-6-metoxy-1,4-benzoquinol methylase
MSATSQRVALQRTLYESRNPTRRWLHRTRRDWVVATIHRLAERGRGSALEIGPGSGVYLPSLTAQFREVIATDIDREYLSDLEPLAAQHPNLKLVEDDVTASRIESASFDLVLCTEVLEHIADSQRALREIHRLLKPGGLLITSTPQRFSPLELTAKVALLPGIIDLVRLAYREPVLPTGHINLMTAREVRRQLVVAGFSVEATHTTGFYLPVVAEFGGEVALRVEKLLEHKLRDGVLGGMLWTQCYVAAA